MFKKLVYDDKVQVLHDWFLNDWLIDMQVRYQLEKRNLKNWDIEDEIHLAY